MLDASSLSDIAALPWQLQLVLASGYCAYLVAFVGLKHTHKAADTIFGTLAFGLVALALLGLIPATVHWLLTGAIAFGASVIAAVLWRWMIRQRLRDLFRNSGYSTADNTPSAWDRLLEGGYKGATQLTVELEDGRYLYCSDAERAGKHPFGPFILGTSGDVLLYVDSSKNADGKELDHTAAAFAGEWGNLLTYVPSSSIRKLSIRII
ncbi:hypothetical protein ACIGGE_11915 [Qipengyuania sp. NPDC077410]|uniref:hypothetical protein n=1 Tax=Qipengyuania sp. NPDC077410 TaxID=3364496 RepID=UPI0037C64B50